MVWISQVISYFFSTRMPPHPRGRPSNAVRRLMRLLPPLPRDGEARVYRRFFFLFRSFGSIHPDRLVLSIGPPGMPRFDSPPPIKDFISLSFPITPIPPTARIMSR